MSKFHVGQRVRVIERDSRHFGAECCVTAIDAMGIDDDVVFHNGIEIDLPCTRSRFHRWCVMRPNMLEPIRDDDSKHIQQETTTWDKCVWKPAQVHA